LTNTILHLAPLERWQTWPAEEPYLPERYSEDGFIHCTAGDELMLRVANHWYRQVVGDFVVLVVDLKRLTAPVRWERPGDELAPLFPHIYGAINRDAIIAIRPVIRAADGTFLAFGEAD
jgi:uncharacterized protein (DUF952 family)